MPSGALADLGQIAVTVGNRRPHPELLTKCKGITEMPSGSLEIRRVSVPRRMREGAERAHAEAILSVLDGERHCPGGRFLGFALLATGELRLAQVRKPE